MSHQRIPGRRSFMSAFTALSGLVLWPRDAGAMPQASPALAQTWDLAWIDELKSARHKQVFDLADADPASQPPPLRLPRNYLDGFRDVYALQHPEVRTVIGITNRAFGLNASDRLWAKYALGSRANIVDPTTKQPAVRNIFMDDATLGVKALQARGTVFWQCAIALNSIAQQIATAQRLAVDDVRADLIAGLNPGVRLVPSHVMALGMVQERGTTYVKV